MRKTPVTVAASLRLVIRTFSDVPVSLSTLRKNDIALQQPNVPNILYALDLGSRLQRGAKNVVYKHSKPPQNTKHVVRLMVLLLQHIFVGTSQTSPFCCQGSSPQKGGFYSRIVNRDEGRRLLVTCSSDKFGGVESKSILFR